MIGEAMNIFADNNANPHVNDRDKEGYGEKKFIKYPTAVKFGLAGAAINPIASIFKNINNPKIYPYGILPPKNSKETAQAAIKLALLGLVNPKAETKNILDVLKSVKPSTLALAGLGAGVGFLADKYQQGAAQYEEDRFNTVSSAITEVLIGKGVEAPMAAKRAEIIADTIRLTKPEVYYSSESKLPLIKSLGGAMYDSQQSKVAEYVEAIFEKASRME
jgi:hypothetical protein